MKPNDLKPTATPEELLRCWEETYKDGEGVDKTRSISLMYRRDVPQFDTPFFNSCMNLYNNWKLFKQSPPLGNGWANERNVTAQILQLLEVENNKYEAWLREKENAKRKS